MAESFLTEATGCNGSELVSRPLADVSDFVSDKWVTLGAPAPLKRGLCQEQYVAKSDLPPPYDYPTPELVAMRLNGPFKPSSFQHV